MIKVREIYLSWRKAGGDRRKIVGQLKRTSSGITFQYSRVGVEASTSEGFKEYPGFPLDYDKVYKEDNLDVFSLRLQPFERKDNDALLSFWEAKGITDKFDLLALTQGLLPTDNFECLGNFRPVRGFKFVSDLAGLSHLSLNPEIVKPGDILSYELERNPRSADGRAVKIYHKNEHLGYIKIIHDNIFKNLKGNHLKVSVKEIEQDQQVRNIFVLIDSTFK